MIKFRCKCGQKIGVPEEHAGKSCKCPKCQAINRIPSVPQDNAQNNIAIETSNDSTGSNIKLWSVAALTCLLIALAIIAIGYPAYKQNKLVEAISTQCQELLHEARLLADQKEYAKAIESFESIKKLIADSKVKTESFTGVLEEADEQIKLLNSKLFSQQHNQMLMDLKGEANDLFMTTMFDKASDKYRQISSFLEEHKKENDSGFGWLYAYCQERIAIPDKLLNISKLKKALGSSSRLEANKQYDYLIDYFQKLRRPSDEINQLVANLQASKQQANAYHDNVEKQIEIAKRKEKEEERLALLRAEEERKRQLAELRRLEEEKKKAQDIRQTLLKHVHDVVFHLETLAYNESNERYLPRKLEGTDLTGTFEKDVQIIARKVQSLESYYAKYCRPDKIVKELIGNAAMAIAAYNVAIASGNVIDSLVPGFTYSKELADDQLQSLSESMKRARERTEKCLKLYNVLKKDK